MINFLKNANPKRPRVVEVEYGPHFLTFYIDPKPQGLQERVYKDFVKDHPELADIQQERFIHEAGDIPMYHSTGCPRDHFKREHWRHFHIRYGRKPVTEDLIEAIRIIGNHADVSDYWLTEQVVAEDYPLRKPGESYDDYKDRILSLTRHP